MNTKTEKPENFGTKKNRETDLRSRAAKQKVPMPPSVIDKQKKGQYKMSTLKIIYQLAVTSLSF